MVSSIAARPILRKDADGEGVQDGTEIGLTLDAGESHPAAYEQRTPGDVIDDGSVDLTYFIPAVQCCLGNQSLFLT